MTKFLRGYNESFTAELIVSVDQIEEIFRWRNPKTGGEEPRARLKDGRELSLDGSFASVTKSVCGHVISAPSGYVRISVHDDGESEATRFRIERHRVLAFHCNPQEDGYALSPITFPDEIFGTDKFVSAIMAPDGTVAAGNRKFDSEHAFIIDAKEMLANMSGQSG